MTAVHESVPIIVSVGAARRAAMNLSSKAENQLKDGDLAGAKRNVDAALHAGLKFWPALYQRAEILHGRGNTNLPLRIAMKRFGNTLGSLRLHFCVPASMQSLENSQKL
jgi:hypothetical protein